MRFKQLEVYSKPENMNQREWEREFLNPIAYPELKRRGLTDQQISNWFGIRFHAVIEYRRNHPQFAIRKRRLA